MQSQFITRLLDWQKELVEKPKHTKHTASDIHTDSAGEEFIYCTECGLIQDLGESN